VQKSRQLAFGTVFEGLSLVKTFTLFGFVVASLFMLVFGLDLALAWPFQRASVSYDIINVLCGAGLAYLSWNAWGDLRKS
jgi:hypothetical protein